MTVQSAMSQLIGKEVKTTAEFTQANKPIEDLDGGAWQRISRTDYSIRPCATVESVNSYRVVINANGRKGDLILNGWRCVYHSDNRVTVEKNETIDGYGTITKLTFEVVKQ